MEREPKVRLISFGAGLHGIDDALMRIRKQAGTFPLIDEVRTYSKQDLTEDYHKLFPDFPVRYPKGYGLWSWKPWLVERELRAMDDGDILLYVDAGVELNPEGLGRFSSYLDLVNQSGFVFFAVELQNRHWTKWDTGLVTTENFFRNQIAATAFFIEASPKGRRFAEKWLRLCSLEGGKHLMDPKDGGQHRHDQSVLSSVVFEESIPVLDRDETYHSPWRDGRSSPILAFRNKTGTSLLKPHLSWLPLHNLRILLRMSSDKTFFPKVIGKVVGRKKLNHAKQE